MAMARTGVAKAAGGVRLVTLAAETSPARSVDIFAGQLPRVTRGERPDITPGAVGSGEYVAAVDALLASLPPVGLDAALDAVDAIVAARDAQEAAERETERHTIRGAHGRFVRKDGTEPEVTAERHAVRGAHGRFVRRDGTDAPDVAPQHLVRGSHGRFVRRDGTESVATKPRHMVRGPKGRWIPAPEPTEVVVLDASPAVVAAPAEHPVPAVAADADDQPKRTARGTWAEKPVERVAFEAGLRLAVWQALADDYRNRGIAFGTGEDLVSPRRAKVVTPRPSGPMGDLSGMPLVSGQVAIIDGEIVMKTDMAVVPKGGKLAPKRSGKQKSLFGGEDEIRAGRDPIAQYLNEIGRYARLSRAEENALSMRSLDATNVEEDRQDAQDTLVKCNLRLAVAIAKDFTRGSLPLMDLVSVANEGLIVASQKFDWRMGTPFGNYASYWCKQRCLKYVAEQGFAVRVPPYRAALVNQVVRTNAKLMQIFGRRPTAPEVMEELNRHLIEGGDGLLEVAEDVPVAPKGGKRGKKVRKAVSLTEVEEVMEMLQAPLELDAPLSAEGDAATFGTWFGESFQDADQALDSTLEAMDLQNAIGAALAGLPAREAQVIQWHFGLGGHRSRDLEQIAEELGVTRERARQIKAQALKRLQDNPALQSLFAP